MKKSTCLESAAKALKADDSADVEPVIDRDTEGVSGAPDIARTILQKIVWADVVVADVSIVTGQKEGRAAPNPNVLIELGYALHAIGEERVLLVFNTAYGQVEQLPFDLRMRRAITYQMPTTDRATERKALQDKLETALKAAFAAMTPKLEKLVAILNSDGTPEPILISGREQSASDPKLTVLSSLIKVVGYTQRPVTMIPQRLVVDGAQWPVHRFFFQPRKSSPPPKLAAITIPGNQAQEFRFNLMFPTEKCPEGRSGIVLFRIDDREEPFALKVRFRDAG